MDPQVGAWRRRAPPHAAQLPSLQPRLLRLSPILGEVPALGCVVSPWQQGLAQQQQQPRLLARDQLGEPLQEAPPPQPPLRLGRCW